ncbi:MAG: hypothetical protein A6D92_04290 [Symbiobacterium thermophilum]|uniref:Uncharacterized protein n=1 Tax=Symbiobacterium thermophilum TaxID=2734 RepID=A0A1Y2T7E5_SYMTR|nr:MAG: hypothetical protein A6D92_04290 [Symbiobacterium thermophilum]
MSAAQKGSRLPLIAGGLLVGLLLLAAVFADEITAVSPHYWDARSSILERQAALPPRAPVTRWGPMSGAATCGAASSTALVGRCSLRPW